MAEDTQQEKAIKAAGEVLDVLDKYALGIVDRTHLLEGLLMGYKALEVAAALGIKYESGDDLLRQLDMISKRFDDSAKARLN